MRTLGHVAAKYTSSYAQLWRFVQVSAGNLALPLAAFAAGPILARGLGVDDRGRFALILVIVSFAPTICGLGQQEATVFWLHKSNQSRSAFWNPVKICLCLGIIGGAVTTSVVALVSELPLGSPIPLASGCYVLLLAVLMPIRARCIDAGRFGLISAERWIQAFSRLGGFALMLALGTFTLEMAFLLHAASVVTGSVILVVGLHHKRKGERQHSADMQHSAAPEPSYVNLRQLLSYGSRVWIGAAALVVILRLDQLVLGVAGTDADLGIYAVAVSIAECLLLMSAAARMILLPALLRSSDATRIVQYWWKFTILGLLFCALFYYLSPVIVTLFGPGFEPAAGLSVVLAPAIVCAAWLDLLGAAHAATGHPEYDAASCIAGAIIALAAIPVILHFGPYGAALGTVAAYTVAAFISTLLLYQTRRRQTTVV